MIRLISTLLCIIVLPQISHADSSKPIANMVVSAHPLATQAGIQLLKKGGNAFDAAAATALALGVVEPGSSGIGGGGFFLLYIAKTHRYVMLDAREMSPKLAGNGSIYQTQSSINGSQSAGVPGLLAGVDDLISKYGRMTREQTLAPAISLARDGFPISPHLHSMIKWRKDVFNDTAQRIFLNHGKTPKAGWILQQKALADTLSRFAQHGANDFYHGETAGRLLADMKRDGGLIRKNDLTAYHAIERKPIQFSYHNAQFISASLPSSGGITLAEILGILKNDPLTTMNRVDRAHLLIEAMKRAYKDRNAYLGDRDFVHIPDLLNPQRLQKLRNSIDLQKATPSDKLTGFAEPIGASVDTTHFSIIDDEGNMVSATLSINYGMGSGYVSPSTGILLNDEMDDFSTRPGKPNAYGLVQGKNNTVAPHKRMLSSMSPTFIIDKNRTFIIGTPGGSRIISMVLLASIAFIDHTLPPQEWINKPHFHHQFLPDIVQYEDGAFDSDSIVKLKKRGHQLKKMHRQYGNMQAILWRRNSGELTGISDARGEGKAMQIQRH